MNEVCEHKPGGYLYTVSFVCLIVGGIVSILLMLYGFRRNPSNLLRAFFVVWVSAPSLVLLFAQLRLKRLPATARRILQSLAVLLTVCSLVIYSYVVVNPPRAQGAFAFIVVPLISTVLIVMTLGLIMIRERRRRQTSK